MATRALENDLSVPKELNTTPNMLPLSSPRYLGEMKACVYTGLEHRYAWRLSFKEPKVFISDEWINNLWCIQSTEYFSAIKRSELLIHDTTWINRKVIVLSKRRQMQRTRIVLFHQYSIQKHEQQLLSGGRRNRGVLALLATLKKMLLKFHLYVCLLLDFGR